MEARTFRVALVGCGRIAQVHSGYLRQIPHVLLVGACDANPQTREAYARRWQLPVFADVEEMLGASQPDMVHVVTPPGTHSVLAQQLLAGGVHVLVEKPMALSVAEADAMVAAARQTGRFLTVDHNRWFDPVLEDARRLLSAGVLGSLVGVDVRQGVVAETSSAGADERWHTGLPGGPLFDSLPHPAYLLHGFLGPIDDLHVTAQADEGGQISEMRAVARGERAIGTLTISRKASPVANRVTLYGTAATAEADLNNMTLVVRRTRRVPKIVGKVLPNVDEAFQLLRATVTNGFRFVLGRQRYYPGIGAHLRALYAEMAAGGTPPVSAETGREVVALAARLWQQAGVPFPERAVPVEQS